MNATRECQFGQEDSVGEGEGEGELLKVALEGETHW